MIEVTMGTLYLVGTPIGNLGDITLRALEVLKAVDLIAAEDTRHTRKLLNHYQIAKALTSYHRHNARERAGQLIEKIKGGQDIALVTDAGMPGISDPGYLIVKEAIQNHVDVLPIPGPSAALAALVVSGLPTDRFVFEGFLPRKKEEVRQRLADLVKEERTIILYEAPHRLKKTLVLCREHLGSGRFAVIARELTKKFEEVLRGTLAELARLVEDREIRGEFCLIISGADKQEIETETEKPWWENISLAEHVDLLVNRGYTKNEAIKETAKERKLPKREVYARYHQVDGPGNQ